LLCRIKKCPYFLEGPREPSTYIYSSRIATCLLVFLESTISPPLGGRRIVVPDYTPIKLIEYSSITTVSPAEYMKLLTVPA